MKNLRSISGTRAPKPCKRVFERRTERQFLDHFAELHLHRIERFVGDGLETGMNVMAGLHGAVEEIDGIGQLSSNLWRRRVRARRI